MKFIEKYKIEDDTMKFTIKNNDNIKLSFVNALRRIILSEIPVYVLDNIECIENNTSLNNEFLKNRLSLLPIINRDDDLYDNIEIGINNINNSEYIKTIYAYDFKVINSDLKIEDIIKYPKIIFTKLKEGNKINFKCKFVKNTALNAGSAYTPANIVTIKFEKDVKEINKMIKEIKDPIKKDNFIKYDSNRIYLKNKKDEPLKYNVTIESSGVMSVKDILIKSLNILEFKLDKIDKMLKNNDILIQNQDSSLGGLDFIFKDEGDTIGNLLSSYLLEENNIKYCNYNIPHPLINKMKIRVTMEEKYKLKDYLDNFYKVISKIKTLINKLNTEINSFS